MDTLDFGFDWWAVDIFLRKCLSGLLGFLASITFGGFEPRLGNVGGGGDKYSKSDSLFISPCPFRWGCGLDAVFPGFYFYSSDCRRAEPDHALEFYCCDHVILLRGYRKNTCLGA